MKKILIAILMFASLQSLGQQAPAYWQQRVDFRINASLNDQEHSIRGVADFTYVNQSPDELSFIWIHCWPNAYKDETSAFAKQLLKEKSGKTRLKAIKDKGFMDSLLFTVNGQSARVEPHPDWNDVVKLVLPAPLKPGDSIRVKTPFFVKLPTYASRGGHSGQSYMVTQWYPKPAVYDRNGWHAMPYLDRGEFYNDFGTYDVQITLPGSYVVGATGVLQNQDERARYIELGTSNRSTRKDKGYSNDAAVKTLSFHAEQVTDFAWFADKKFMIEYDTLQLEGSAPIDVFTYHRANTDEGWQRSAEFVKSAVRFYSSEIGPYAYPVVQAVEGPKNDMSGGMEYPMITLINMPDAIDSSLDVVITHEVGHNWFPMMVSSNERRYPWMDEGFNTYYEHIYSAEKYRTFGGANSLGIPSYLQNNSADELRSMLYRATDQVLKTTQPLNTSSEDFKNDAEYGMVAYERTAIWLYGFEAVVGKYAFRSAMQNYFQQWRFRHPQPADFQASLEASLQTDLKSMFEALEIKGSFVK
jgi:hypothetical protein